MTDEILEQQKKRLSEFDPSKPFIIKASEIEGMGDYGDARFVIKRPTVSDRIKIGIRDAKYKENLTLDNLYSNLTHLLATFSVLCTESPKGFDFEAVYEYDSLYVLYDRFNEWLQFFRLSVQERQEIISGTGK